MLFLCTLPVGYAIVWLEPSWHCGPFSEYIRAYKIFTNGLQQALPDSLNKVTGAENTGMGIFYFLYVPVVKAWFMFVR